MRIRIGVFLAATACFASGCILPRQSTKVRLDSLEGRVQTLNEGAETLTGRIDTLTGTLRLEEGRIDTLTGSLQRLQELSAALDDASDKKIAELHDRITILQREVESGQTRSETLARDVSEVSKAVEYALSEREKTSALIKTLDGLSGRLAQTEAGLDRARADLTAQGGQWTTFEKKLEGRIDVLTGLYNTVRKRNEELGESLDLARQERRQAREATMFVGGAAAIALLLALAFRARREPRDEKASEG